MNKILAIKKIALLPLFLYLLSTVALAQQAPLQFDKDGKFKIVQFTDTHFKYMNFKSRPAIACIKKILKAEKPDLVVFTGDIITASPAGKGLRRVLDEVIRHKIPFAITLGNHDDEKDMSRTELYELIRTVPYCLMPADGTESDYILPVLSSSGSKNAALLYMIDSNSYAQIEGKGLYGWITTEQINWYLERSREYTVTNNGIPVPALAFFHIPLPEYHEAASHPSSILVGTKKEKVCAPEVNTGMFDAICRAGDVMGVFVGHDHNNDYAVMWKNVLLAYGRYSGGDTAYHSLRNGARVIELYEGSREFTSWIRLTTNEVIHKIHYPDTFATTARHP